MCDHECITCPFAFNEESERAQNYGCLPEPFDLIQMRVEFGKTWACHNDYTKPCVGTIQELKERGHPYKVIDPKLVNLDSDWEQYTNWRHTK